MMCDKSKDVKPVVSKHFMVSLREITEETLSDILKLKVSKEQEKFVASNAVSIAQAHFSDKAWFRAIYADDTPVGFVMLYDDAEKPEYFLWRFMIDKAHQKKDFGRRALQLLIDYVKTRPGAKKLLCSYVPGEGGPKDFYLKYGFKPNGDKDGGEIVIELQL